MIAINTNLAGSFNKVALQILVASLTQAAARIQNGVGPSSLSKKVSRIMGKWFEVTIFKNYEQN